MYCLTEIVSNTCQTLCRPLLPAPAVLYWCRGKPIPMAILELARDYPHLWLMLRLRFKSNKYYYFHAFQLLIRRTVHWPENKWRHYCMPGAWPLRLCHVALLKQRNVKCRGHAKLMHMQNIVAMLWSHKYNSCISLPNLLYYYKQIMAPMQRYSCNYITYLATCQL